VIASITATLAAIGKKLLAALAGDKNGRKFLGYVIGIALFIVLIPLIVAYSLFAWMGADENLYNFDLNNVYENMPEHQAVFMQIESTFKAHDLSDTDISKAKTLYVSCLIGRENDADFYEIFAECFKGDTEPLSSVSSAFGVVFSDDEKQYFYNLWG